MDTGNIIVEAKKQYTQQLIDVLTPFLYEGIKSIFDKCKDERAVLRKFQEKLCYIPKWNQSIIDGEYTRIVDNSGYDWLDKLIEAIFICNVKILSTIRNCKETINIKIPETRNFIHACYIECARYFYKNPYSIDDRSFLGQEEITKNFKAAHSAIEECIDKTIRELIPQKEIVETCLKQQEDNFDPDAYKEPQGDHDDPNLEPEQTGGEASGDASLEGVNDESPEEGIDKVFMNNPGEEGKPGDLGGPETSANSPALDMVEGNNISQATEQAQPETIEIGGTKEDDGDLNFFSDED